MLVGNPEKAASQLWLHDGNQHCSAAGAALPLHPGLGTATGHSQANERGRHHDAIMLQEQAAEGADQQSLGAFHEPLAGFFSVAQLSGH